MVRLWDWLRRHALCVAESLPTPAEEKTWVSKISKIAEQISKRASKNCERCKVLQLLASNISSRSGYMRYWTEYFNQEIKSEGAESVGRQLVTVLKSALELARFCRRNGHEHVLSSSGEFSEIIDDFRRYAAMLNRLIHIQLSFKDPSRELLPKQFHGKIDQDCTFLLQILDSSDKQIDIPIPQVKYKDLVLLKDVLGSGAFGYVQKGIWKGTEVALKILQHLHQEELETPWKLQRENSSHILKLLGHSEDEVKSNTILILELMDKDINKLIQDKRKPSLPSLVEIILQIAKGMRHLHKNNVLHRDLKPGNILVRRKSKEITGEEIYQVKIADFGVCIRDFSTQDRHSLHVGTPEYMAPEMRSSNLSDVDQVGDYTRKTDVYSFGITCKKIIPKTEVHSSLHELITRALVEDAVQRPCFEEICEELWIVMEEMLAKLSGQDIKNLVNSLYFVDIEPQGELITDLKLEGGIVEGQKVRVHFKLGWFYCVTSWMRQCPNGTLCKIKTDTWCRGPAERIVHEYLVKSDDIDASDIIIKCCTRNCSKSVQVRARLENVVE